MASPFDVTLADLRLRRSAKWTTFPPDVLPLPVAEMDVILAEPVQAALLAAVERSDTGYAGDATSLREAFAGFTARRWRWQVDPALVTTAPDVAVAAVETMRTLLSPGDRVVIMPPVYPPFWPWLRGAGLRAVEVPLLAATAGGRLDLDGIEAALAGGAGAVLLCHPQNPTGYVSPGSELRALATLAARHGALVISDEIHAPLVHPGETFEPFLAVSDEAREVGIALQSASKGWNLAGLKCACVVAGTPAMQARLAPLADVLPWAVGHLGAIAAEAAYVHGEPWLDQVVAALAAHVDVLTSELAARLPEVTFDRPQATFLAWLDCRGLALGDDPAARFLERGRVGLADGPGFGAAGRGFARLNLGCSPQVIGEAVSRMAAAAGSDG